jgi:hypothetical protein
MQQPPVPARRLCSRLSKAVFARLDPKPLFEFPCVVSVPPAARLAPASEPSGVRASMVEGAAVVINGPHPLVPIERCQRVNSPWMRGREHLSAPAHQEQMQGVRGGEHLPAPAPKEQMQGVRGGEHLPAPAHQEQMQGVPRGGGHVDAGRPGGARGFSACCW